MKADFVSNDGTFNLSNKDDPSPSVSYKFYQDSQPPQNISHAGVVTKEVGKLYLPVTVLVHEPYSAQHTSVHINNSNYDYEFTTKGIDRIPETTPINLVSSQILTPPKCNLKDLWIIASSMGAKDFQLASILYNKDGYSFTINEGVNLFFDKDCKVIDNHL